MHRWIGRYDEHGRAGRASRRTTLRYQHHQPGDLIHLDVKNSAVSPTAADGTPMGHKFIRPHRTRRPPAHHPPVTNVTAEYS